MGLIRFLILALVVWLVWRMFQNYKARQEKKAGASPRGKRNKQKMVKCGYCAVHLPEASALGPESIDETGREQLWFCNRAHRAQFLSDQSSRDDASR